MKIKKSCVECAGPFEVKPYRESTARYCSRRCSSTARGRENFNRTPTKPWSIGNTHRCGLKPSNAFTEGHEPWNKGATGIHLSPGTEFQPGQRPGNWLPVGSVTIRHFTRDDSQRAFVKVAESNRWRARAVVNWEAVNGPVPRGKVVHHKDRDTLNDDPANLEALTRAQHEAEHHDELVAAVNTRRRALGIEMSPEYAEIAAQRLSKGDTRAESGGHN